MQNDNDHQSAAEFPADDPFPAGGEFIPEGRRVPAGSGIGWLGSGWEMFRQAPATWIVVSFGFLLIMIVLGMIPLVNFFANMLIPVFAGGIMMGCKALDEGGELRVSHLFAGFSGPIRQLLVVGAIYLAGLLTLVLLMMVVGGGFLLGGGNADAGTGMLAMLLALFFFVPLAMAVWYAPPLVVFHAMPPTRALQASFLTCLKNFLPFLIYGLVFTLLAILASLPIFLGWLVLLPVAQASAYAGYREMFTRT